MNDFREIIFLFIVQMCKSPKLLYAIDMKQCYLNEKTFLSIDIVLRILRKHLETHLLFLI